MLQKETVLKIMDTQGQLTLGSSSYQKGSGNILTQDVRARYFSITAKTFGGTEVKK